MALRGCIFTLEHYSDRGSIKGPPLKCNNCPEVLFGTFFIPNQNYAGTYLKAEVPLKKSVFQRAVANLRLVSWENEYSVEKLINFPINFGRDIAGIAHNVPTLGVSCEFRN